MRVYNKLVRDKIPDIIKENGNVAIVRILSDDEILEFLAKKLHEEVEEYLEDETVEELVDIYEVILTILKQRDISFETFEIYRKNKALQKGGFSQRILLDSVIKKENKKQKNET